MPDPIIEKAAGDNIPFTHDWSKDLARLGDALITESHWNVDAGSVTIGSDGRPSFIASTVTGCFIQGGTPDEYCVLNNSILLNKAVDPDSGDKLVRRFIVHILDGLWEPMTPPVVILPDGLPDIPTLEAFRGATPGVSIWVDVTPSYPAGDLYYAVPDSFTGAPVDGNTVVQGQLVKWVSIHSLGSYTGLLPSRRIDTTAPLVGGGDLSADRTLSVQQVTTVHAGVAPQATPNISVFSVDPSGVVAWRKISGSYLTTTAGITSGQITSVAWSTVTGTPTTLTGYGITDAPTVTGTPNVLAKFTAAHAVGDSALIDDGTFSYVLRDATGAANSPIDWAQFAVRGATDSAKRIVVAIDTTHNIGMIQAGKSGTSEYPLVLSPKGSWSGVGGVTPLANWSITGDSNGADPIVSGQLIISGATDSNKRFGFKLDTTNNIGLIQAGILGVDEYSISFGNGFVGFGNIRNPSAGVDTTTLRVRSGLPATGRLMQSDSIGSASWTDFADAGFTPWSPYVTVNSGDTVKTISNVTFSTDTSRASQIWVRIYEIEVYARTSSSATALCIYKLTQSIAVQYDGSGNATIAYVTGQTDGTELLGWQNHTGGVPAISGIYLGAVVGNSVPITLSKPGSTGAVFSARARYRAISQFQTNNWY